jgi:tripartite-type tricarboxylate transporter receptor subunit TctC
MNKSPQRSRIQLVAGLAAAFLIPFSSAVAQKPSYPTKPITIVVVFPAGGDNDALARMLAEKLSSRLEQPVIVENRTGGGGSIGTSYASKANPDGYTLLLATNTISITPHVMDNAIAKVHPTKDLTPIAQLASQSLYVIVDKKTGVTNLKELTARIKAGKITSYATPGYGTPMHIMAELFDKEAGVRTTHVPYRGSVPAVQDIIGGHIPMMYGTLGPAQQHIDAGRLTLLAVADRQRSPSLPNVPTTAEAGFPGVQIGAWVALMGPKNMPADIARLLNQHCQEILRMPDIVERMKTISMVPEIGSPEQMATLAASDYDRYQKLVKEFGIHAE